MKRVIVLCIGFGIFMAGTLAEDLRPTRVVGVNSYDHLARAANIQGKVEVTCEIDRDGSVLRTRVISGHPFLARMAERNLSQWKFSTDAAIEAKPHEMTFIYEFRLGEPTREHPLVEFVFDYPNQVFVSADGMCADHIPCTGEEWRQYQKDSKKSGRSNKHGIP
jgi:TonB family protein